MIATNIELAQARMARGEAMGGRQVDLDGLRRFAVHELRKEQDRDMQAFGVVFLGVARSEAPSRPSADSSASRTTTVRNSPPTTKPDTNGGR